MSGFSVVNTSTLTSVPALYKVVNAFTGAAVGDILQSVEIYNQQVNPAVVIDTVWSNLTQQTSLGAITPLAADIAPIDSTSSTTDVVTTALYTAVVAQTDYAIGDVIQQVVVLDPSTVPSTVVSTEYNNLTQDTRNITIVAATDIVPGSSSAGSTLSAISTIYTALTGSTDYNNGDNIEAVQVYDISVTPPTLISTTYNNLSQNTTNITINPSDFTEGNANLIYPVITQLYTAVADNVGQYTIGDIIERVQVLNVIGVRSSGSYGVQVEGYNNLTTGTNNITIGAASDITPGTVSTTTQYSDVVSYYTAIAGATDYNVNDIIQRIDQYNPANLPDLPTVTQYNNITQGTFDIPVSLGDLLPVDAKTTENVTIGSSALYTVVTAGTGTVVGDVLQLTTVYDPLAAPPTPVSQAWANLTQGTDLSATPPNYADLTPGQTQSVAADAVYTANYKVVTAGTGTSVDDVLQRVVTINPVTSAIVATVWDNLTAGTTLGTAPNYADITPISTTSSDVVTSAFYIAKTANTDYAIGDTLQEVVITDPVTNTVVSTTWKNLTQGTVLAAAPVLAEVTASQSQLPPAIGPQTSSNSLSVYVANPSSLSYFPVVTQYAVSTAFVLPAPGAALGDVVQSIEVYDATVSPATLVSTSWSNLTTGVTYATAPSIADLTPTFGNALTNAELRAAPVVVTMTPVSRVSAMVSVGASTTSATAAGIVSASFYNNSTSVAATVAGGTLPPSTAISFQANDTDTLAAISYTTDVGGSLLIATLT